MSYKILCDSCTDLTPAQRKDPHFHIVPLTIQVGGRVFVDEPGMDCGELLWAIKSCPDAPKTSCPAPAQYLELFEGGEQDIYVVTLSALLSGSHNVAVQARSIHVDEGGGKNIHIFNSCSASAGQVCVAMRIQELAESGLPFQKVVAETEKYVAEMKTLFVLESLDNLRKNGRLTGLKSVVTGALKIKLLMGATPAGEICKLGQGISIKQTLSKMVDMVAQDKNHEGRRLVLSHCNCLERAFYVRELLESKCRLGEIIITETAGISTVYANDGGVVLAY